MNYKTAVKILEIDIEKEELNNNIIKKKYRMLALQFHPDKNNTEYARTKFHDIQNAYEFLTKNNKSEDDDIDTFVNEQTYSYTDLLGIFLKSLSEEGGFGNNINDVQFKIYQNILQKISRLCEERTIELLKNINKKLLFKIYEVLFKYQNVL